MYTKFLGTTRRSLTAFGGPGYPQFRANRTPFLRFAPEQPLRTAATIPGAFRTESIKEPALYEVKCSLILDAMGKLD